MATFKVKVKELIEYTVEVEAKDEDEACELGEQLIIDTADRDKWCSACLERDAEVVA